MAPPGSAFSTKEFEHLPSADRRPQAAACLGEFPLFLTCQCDSFLTWHWLAPPTYSLPILPSTGMSGWAFCQCCSHIFFPHLSLRPNTCSPPPGGPVPGPWQHAWSNRTPACPMLRWNSTCHYFRRILDSHSTEDEITVYSIERKTGIELRLWHKVEQIEWTSALHFYFSFL